MKARLKSPVTVLVVVLALLVTASIVIWMQIGMHLGITQLVGSGAGNHNLGGSGNDEILEPSSQPDEEEEQPMSAPITSDLEQYPGFRLKDSALDEQAFAAEELAREYLTTICMEEQGWQYFPAPSVRNGVGVNDGPERLNEDYVAALSPSERTAYYLALTGVADPNDEVNGYAPGVGCSNESLQQIPGVYALSSELRESLDRLENRVKVEVAGSEDYQNAYREALIFAHNEFAAEHRTVLEEFQRAHEDASALVGSLIHHWDERA